MIHQWCTVWNSMPLLVTSRSLAAHHWHGTYYQIQFSWWEAFPLKFVSFFPTLIHVALKFKRVYRGHLFVDESKCPQNGKDHEQLSFSGLWHHNVHLNFVCSWFIQRNQKWAVILLLHKLVKRLVRGFKRSLATLGCFSWFELICNGFFFKKRFINLEAEVEI